MLVAVEFTNPKHDFRPLSWFGLSPNGLPTMLVFHGQRTGYYMEGTSVVSLH